MRRILNIGVIANDGTGDKLRHAFDLSQQNFVELYTFFGDGENITSLSVRQKLDTPTNAEVNQKISTAINPAFVHIESTSNPHGVTKAQVGLPDVDNTSDANKPISTKAQTALDLKADKASKGAANGIASLDVNKKVPIAELPDASINQKGVVQLVNDLTTGGAGKAITAEQAKLLRDGFTASYSGSRGWKKDISGTLDQYGFETLTAVGNFNSLVVGNLTIYTSYYRVTLPLQYPISCRNVVASVWTPPFTAQDVRALITVNATVQDNNTIVIAYSTPWQGSIPYIYWRTTGQ